MKRFRSSSRWHEGNGEYVTVCSCRELRKHHPDVAHDVIESIGRAKAKRTEFVVYPSLESFAGLMLEEQVKRMDSGFRALLEESIPKGGIDDAGLRRTARQEIARHTHSGDGTLWSNGSRVVSISPAPEGLLRSEEALIGRLKMKMRAKKPKKGIDYASCTREAPYTAMEIADYIVFWCHMEKVPISSLKTQALLYFVQGRFLAGKGYPCFSEDIDVSDYGPIIISVQREYRVYGSLNIPCTDTFDRFSGIDPDDMKLLDSILDGLAGMSKAQLTEIIRRQTPWTDAKEREEITEDSRISLEDLLELFSQ